MQMLYYKNYTIIMLLALYKTLTSVKKHISDNSRSLVDLVRVTTEYDPFYNNTTRVHIKHTSTPH